MNHIFLYALLFLCATLPTSLNAAAEQDPEETERQRLKIGLEQADIKDFIRWASVETGKNIILHPSVKGKVTVLLGDELSPQEAYGVFLSTLQVHGYAIVPSDEALKVIPSREATSLYAPFSNAMESGYTDDVVVRVMRALHLPAEQLVALVKPLLSESSFAHVVSGTSIIIAGDTRGKLDRVVELFNEIDKSGSTEVRSFPIKFANAQQVKSQIEQLLPNLFQSAKPDAPRIIVDERTSTLIASGKAFVLDELHALTKQLDQPSISDSQTKVAIIDYLDASELVTPLLNVANSLKDAGSNSGGIREVSISVNESNNALIITAPSETYTALQSVIHQLDVRRTQVLVEAIIVEVSAEKVLDFGINWSSDLPSDDGLFVGGGLLGDTNAPSPPTFGTGLSLGFYRNGDLRGLVRAIAGDADTNFLSTPTLVTLDNHEAEILVGQNIPLITGSATGSASSTDNPFQTIQRQDIGVGLRVTPRVNSDNSMTLEVSQTVETVSPATVGATDIVTTKREISTKVLIEDDEVLVLGGLMRDDLSQNVSKVPLLGDLPLLGRLFRSSSDEVIKRNLMVFIHPRILRSSQDNVEVTTRYRQSVDAARREFLRKKQQLHFSLKHTHRWKPEG